MAESKESLPRGLQFSRRNLLIGTGVSVGALTLLGFRSFSEISPRRPEAIGTTFSPRYTERNLGLNPQETFREILSMGFDRIRLCTYWPEVQPQAGDFQVRDIEGYLNDAARANVQIILTVGMKAPRYPEFFIPGWVAEKSDTNQNSKPLDSDPNLAGPAKEYVLKMIDHFKVYSPIDGIQLENEPFNRISVAKYRYLSDPYIRNLANEIRRITENNLELIITNSTPLNPFRVDEMGKISVSAEIADTVGKNVYILVPNDLGGVAQAGIVYFSLLRAQKLLLDKLGAGGMIAESQFEPWMINDKPLQGTDNPQVYYDLAMFMGGMGYKEVLIWGIEYAKKQNALGNYGWNQQIERLLAA